MLIEADDIFLERTTRQNAKPKNGKIWLNIRTSTPSGQPRRINREAPGSQGDCIVVSEEDEKDVASNKVPENSEYEDDDDDDEDMEMSAEHAFSVVLKNE
ncbi:hypothetical protein DPMN_171749 [Dreissena polymorpha]|uniref:Uncharacterized protein n=1 Tax=Dreissena polymorpha TaxID=45954 RepID=A0A9D4E292_DREPO|nr:hypothetical protein DPMN_171749 [Dreissena polymorpha]